MRELVSAAVQGKPTIALLELDASKGGLSNAEIRRRLVEAEASFDKWGFHEILEDGARPPSAEALYEHLFQSEPIEWNRFGHFQDATMRLIAERLLPMRAARPSSTRRSRPSGSGRCRRPSTATRTTSTAASSTLAPPRS